MNMYSIGEISQKTGCHIESIRQYEKRGLLKKPLRTESGHRRYGDSHVSIITLIMQFRRADFSLNDIKDILEDLNQNTAPCGTMEDHSLKYAHLIEEKKKILDQCEKMLFEMSGRCLNCDISGENTPIEGCPLVNELLNNFDPQKDTT